MQISQFGSFLILFLAISFGAGCTPGKAPTGGQGVSSPTTGGFRGSRPPDQTAVSTGGWESSGGGGVACFDSENDARFAQHDLKNMGFLSVRTRSKIKSVVTLDNWDFVTDRQHGREPVRFINDYLTAKSFPLHRDLLRDLSPKTILKKITKNIEPEIPLFAGRLKLVQENFPISKWIPSDRIPMVDDSTPQNPIPKNCVRVQIANRFTKSIPERLPETQIFYDQQLFQFLTVLDKALLVNHEHLYLIGKEGGHQNSDQIRKINAFLFSDDVFQRDPYSQLSTRALRLRQIIGYPFGDYMRFFLNEPEYRGHAVPGMSQSRYLSLISLMKKMRKAMEICMSAPKADQGLCQKQTVENLALQATLNPEEAFLFIARFHLDQRAWDFNSELLTVPGHEPLATLQCQEMSERPVVPALETQEKAKLYCRNELRLTTSLLKELPMRRGFSCYSPKHTVVFHSQDHLIIAIDEDPITGSIRSPPFRGRQELQSSIRGALVRDFGLKNVEYQALDTYRLWPASSTDEDLIQSLIEREPSVLKSITLGYSSNPNDLLVIGDSRVAQQALRSPRKPKIFSFDMNLECIVRESNLPESVWWYR
ncbi:MAG: hypothetical protein K2X47_13665 [Bdellovibrionales bacterium]|nr:hypothetical protein [Bdellovibrionales bacterium]